MSWTFRPRQICLTTVVALAVFAATSWLSAGKPVPPPPPPPPPGTIFFTVPVPGTYDSTFLAMNVDGADKTIIPLPYAVPCDQVHGSDPKQDRWYLTSARTATYDKFIRADGTEYIPSDPGWYDHYEVFAYRSNPANRNDLVVVQLTDLFGYVWPQQSTPGWSNDSNESWETSYIASWARDVRGCVYVDEDGKNVIDCRLDPSKESPKYLGYRLPLTASDIQTALELGVDISYRPEFPDDFDQLVMYGPGGGPSTSPDGNNYLAVENNKLVVRQTLDGALVRVLWDGTQGKEPKYPQTSIWSRDGSTVVFRNGENSSYTSAGGIWRISATGGAPVQLVADAYKGFKYTSYRNPVWSPDSQFLCITYLLEDYSGSGGRKVTKDFMRLPAAGGTLTNLTGDMLEVPGSVYRWVSNTVAP